MDGSTDVRDDDGVRATANKAHEVRVRVLSRTFLIFRLTSSRGGTFSRVSRSARSVYK